MSNCFIAPPQKSCQATCGLSARSKLMGYQHIAMRIYPRASPPHVFNRGFTIGLAWIPDRSIRESRTQRGLGIALCRGKSNLRPKQAKLVRLCHCGVTVTLLGAAGALGTFRFPATTKRVMLCGGSVDPKLLPLMPISARRLMAFAAVNCQTCAAPL